MDEVKSARTAERETFSLATPTAAEFDTASEEVTLSNGLVACVVPAASTPKQANQWRQEIVKSAGKKALQDTTRTLGAPSIRIQARGLAKNYLRYLRTPNGQRLELSGMGVNGAEDVPRRVFEDGRIESEEDRIWAMETFPRLFELVSEAVDDLSERFAESMEAAEGNS